ncbi:DUF7556 family protein [Halomarina ordinaria]|uniref:Uncharacterized protein n=1 Tax=Halomarina ordinaria TaxID=3033939 RepID=A0ABD5U9Q9_9EURY|nr:hypothetical protein [Halomarina sp. PSRA2]
MEPNTATTSGSDAEYEVMAAVDDGTLVIADVSRDDAWVALPLSQALSLDDYQ